MNDCPIRPNKNNSPDTIVYPLEFCPNPLERVRFLRRHRALDLMARRFRNPGRCRKTWMNNNCYHLEIEDSIIFPFLILL